MVLRIHALILGMTKPRVGPMVSAASRVAVSEPVPHPPPSCLFVVGTPTGRFPPSELLVMNVEKSHPSFRWRYHKC